MSRYINYERINAKLLASKRVQETMRGKMQEKFDEAKEELIKEFLEHDVSQEILNPSNGNISGTLDGKDNKSLFGFIGFEAGSEPVLEVVAKLENEIQLTKNSPKIQGKKMIFKIRHPSLRELYQATPMPWESGRSWLYGITHGISGFGYFLAGVFKSNHSRSGQGIQLEEEIRGGSYTPPSQGYIEKMIAKFRAKFGAGTN